MTGSLRLRQGDAAQVETQETSRRWLHDEVVCLLAGDDAAGRPNDALAEVRIVRRGHRSLARALAPEPAIIFADEPTGNLDETTGKEIMDLLFTKRAEKNATLVIVTHDIGLGNRCDRVIRMRSGEAMSESPKAMRA